VSLSIFVTTHSYNRFSDISCGFFLFHFFSVCRSFYTPDGCTGTAAQYDILPASSPCAEYADYTGTFSCDIDGKCALFCCIALSICLYNKFQIRKFQQPVQFSLNQLSSNIAGVIVLEKFAPTTAETFYYPLCDPVQYLSTVKQTFACADQRATPGTSVSGQSSVPVFQTVQCFTAPLLPFEGVAVDAVKWTDGPEEEE